MERGVKKWEEGDESELAKGSRGTWGASGIACRTLYHLKRLFLGQAFGCRTTFFLAWREYISICAVFSGKESLQAPCPANKIVVFAGKACCFV
jgi:hypothetical protein